MSDTSAPGWWQGPDGTWNAPSPNDPVATTPDMTTAAEPPTVDSVTPTAEAPTPAPERSPKPSPPATNQLMLSGRSLPWPIVTILLASIIVALGSLLPWASVSTAFGTVSKNGTTGDGVLTLILAGVTLCFALAMLRKPHRGWVIGSGSTMVITLGISIYDMSNLPTPSGAATAVVSVDVGTGLWLCLIGAVVGIAASVVVIRARPVPAAPGSTNR
jgi:hypothetical protein